MEIELGELAVEKSTDLKKKGNLHRYFKGSIGRK